MKELATIPGLMKKTAAALLTFVVLHASLADCAVFDIGPGDVAGLISAIHTANSNGEDNTINLAAGIYSLTEADNVADITNGSNGLPVISGKITLRGQGEISTIIQREQTAAEFRIFRVEQTGNLTLEGLTIRFGEVDLSGAGAILNLGIVNIANVIISNNIGGQGRGGGIRNHGTMNIAQSIIANNSADDAGGIFSFGVLNINRTTVSDNRGAFTGGLELAGGSTSIIVNSTIIFNRSVGFPAPNPLGSSTGGITNGGIAEIINSTIGNNLGFIGGIANGGNIHIINSTIAGNQGALQPRPVGGGISNDGVIEMQNTILALNTVRSASLPPDIVSSDCVGEITSLGNNLLGTPAGCSFTFLASDLTGDPGLGTLQDIEDAGKGHFPLLANSQAIDAGNDIVCLINPLLNTDQLGLPRVGPCDIGSVEFQGGRMVVSIDVRPRSDANKINPNSTKEINVAILLRLA